jgi:[NiFe] hydrogenase assembly HybE family chaperone
MNCPDTLSAGLEAAFTRIQYERMADIPLLNPVLKVQCVGFSVRESYCLGVLITPWFMNLMLLPLAGDEWAELPSGTKINKSFPSGTYEFILGEEAGVGRYLMCSLFSPVFEFQNQEAAVVTAEAVLQSLMDETCRDEVSTREREIRTIWSGEDATTAAVAVAGDEIANRPSLEERIQKPISRRDVLRGAFLPGGKE